MNNDTLPSAVALFPQDVLPSNQRNLTDVRTRIGILLEYEFAKAIIASLTSAVKAQGVALTYVIANQFPDLAFRAPDGRIGVRFEMKAIEATAEENSANFSTLIKDIRKGTDFVVVLLWEWRQDNLGTKKYPHIYGCFVMDAYQLAQMRDFKWLNSPPSGLRSARQGFDLNFAVNARVDSYNKEEGNFGKLMRIFDRETQDLLPESLDLGKTPDIYFLMTEEVVRLGLYHIVKEIVEAAFVSGSSTYSMISESLPICALIEGNENRFIVLGNRRMPSKREAIDALQDHGADFALLLNEKFQWNVRDRDMEIVIRGTKPSEAIQWIVERWEDFTSSHLF